MANATDQSELVAFESHPRTAPVAEAAPGQFIGDLLGADGEAGGQPFDDDAQRWPVTLSGREEAQHLAILERALSLLLLGVEGILSRGVIGDVDDTS